ncbi:uncharacterized protein VTP21DRAFT_3659 [Calcarisporiella thermophila]|uniref:uncharacterized protein n=1 Tax=Calcarisporiella thermophila TaxID=911321 RepID=UPI00374250A8
MTESISPEYSQPNSFASLYPILTALLPAAGPILYGKSEVWNDLMWLGVVTFYLYIIVKAPWEVYELTSKKRRELERAMHASRVTSQNSSRKRRKPEAKDSRYSRERDSDEEQFTEKLNEIFEDERAFSKLKHQELFCFLVVLVSPYLAGLLLEWANQHLYTTSYVSEFNLRLFQLAASIRPLKHLISVVRGRAENLHNATQSSKVGRLRRENELMAIHLHIAQLEKRMKELQSLSATKQEIFNMQEDLAPRLTNLHRQLRQFTARRDFAPSAVSEERFARFEARLRENEKAIGGGFSSGLWLVAWVLLPARVVMQLMRFMIIGGVQEGSSKSLLSAADGGAVKRRKKRPPALRL